MAVNYLLICTSVAGWQYLHKCVPKSTADSGNLVVCLSDQEDALGVEESQQNIIDVMTGSLCLFPSSLYHYTVPFDEKEDRIVLAFDAIPKA